jgi:pseudouridine-5'-monophosphatase
MNSRRRARALGRAVGPNEDDGAGVGEAEHAERARGLVFEDAIPGVQAGKRAGMSGVLFCFILIFCTPV